MSASLLEERLAGFARIGLLKIAGVITDDPMVALLPDDDRRLAELAAAALESIASLATVLAAELRGEEALR